MVSMEILRCVGQKEIHFLTTHVAMRLYCSSLCWSSQMRPEVDYAEGERKSGSEIFTMT